MRTELPPLSSPVARAILTRTAHDQLLHATTALLLYVGLRPTEAFALKVSDYTSGTEPTLMVTEGRWERREIRIAPSAAAALDTYLAGEDTSPEEPLLLGMRSNFLHGLLRDAADEARVNAGVHDLRRAAVAAAMEGGHSAQEIGAYFGMSTPPGRKDLVPLRDGWGAGVAGTLEAAFTE
jgi:integrase